MPANYDNSAGFYDRLSRVVFGRALVEAQVHLLWHIPANARVLIVGGGTGWILEEITRLHPSGLRIVYVEISVRMTEMARKRNVGENTVEFINKDVQEAELPQLFDVVITPFLFDNFTETSLPPIFNHIHHILKPTGFWLYTDFRLTGRWWQYLLLKSMLLFFKVLCGVESWHLPDVAKQFSMHGYIAIDEKCFFGDFVVSKAYKKCGF